MVFGARSSWGLVCFGAISNTLFTAYLIEMPGTVFTSCVIVLSACSLGQSTDLYKDNAVKYDGATFQAAVGNKAHFVKFFAPW